MKEKNIGGYDENYKYDRKAINYLEKVVLESKLMIPHLEAGDKLPNLDGYLELCESAKQKINPVGRFDVQVKSLNHDYRNNNVRDNTVYSYKYSCDTKVVNVVLGAQTCNPVLLILVDSKNERIFWRYMSVPYCLELDVGTQENKTIYFDESDEVINPDQWYDVLYNIYKEVSYAQQHGDENYFLLLDKERNIPVEVQDMSDYLNHLLDNELWFIKQAYFQDAWKIGIAYLDGGGDSFSCVGLYKIKRGKNDLFIKQFKEGENYFWDILYGGSYSLEKVIKKTLKRWIDNFFQKDHYVLSLFPDVVLSELFFKEMDSIITEQEMKDETKEHVVLGWNGTSLLIREFDELADNIRENPFLLSVKCELEKRGIDIICRPWEEIVNYHISRQDEHCTEYKEDTDREKVNRNNMERFLKEFEQFFVANREKFGSRSEKVFELRTTYVLVVDDNMEGYVCGEKEASQFSLEFHIRSENENLYKELIDSIRSNSKKYKRIGGGRIVLGDHSWYKLWRIFNCRLFSSYIGVENNHNITMDYIASM